MHIDSFSGAAAALPKGQRTPEHILAALRRNPRVSVWDMSEYRWLRDGIATLIDDKRIENAEGQYPWCRYRIVEQGPE